MKRRKKQAKRDKKEQKSRRQAKGKNKKKNHTWSIFNMSFIFNNFNITFQKKNTKNHKN